MDTAVNMRIVGAEMDHVEEIRNALTELLGATPSITTRMEINLGSDQVVITVTDAEITVREQPSGRIVAQGGWELARAALAGMPANV